MNSDRLRQSSFHGQAEGDLSSSSSGGLWAPQSRLRILAKLPHQLWGSCSCLNPVPQERHLLVIGTMEMAAGFWTWLWAASFQGRKKGERSDSVRGRRIVCSATSVFPFSGLQPHPPGQEPAKSKVQPIPLGEERSQGTGGKEGVRRVPSGAGLPVPLPCCGRESHPPLFKVPLGLGSQVRAGWSPGHLGEPLPNPGTKIARRRAPRCSRGTTGMPAGAGGLWLGPPWRR